MMLLALCRRSRKTKGVPTYITGEVRDPLPLSEAALHPFPDSLFPPQKNPASGLPSKQTSWALIQNTDLSNQQGTLPIINATKACETGPRNKLEQTDLWYLTRTMVVQNMQ